MSETDSHCMRRDCTYLRYQTNTRLPENGIQTLLEPLTGLTSPLLGPSSFKLHGVWGKQKLSLLTSAMSDYRDRAATEHMECRWSRVHAFTSWPWQGRSPKCLGFVMSIVI